MDGEETDVDCGGSECSACGLGQHCGQDSDCESERCQQGICVEQQNGLSIQFVDPTEPDGAEIDRNWFEVAVSITSDEPASGFIDWDHSLVGYWAFDEGTGEQAGDSSSYDHPGVAENGPQWVSGLFGTALSFDGDDDRVVVDSDGDLEVSGPFTIEVWIRPSQEQEVCSNSPNEVGNFGVMAKASNGMEGSWQLRFGAPDSCYLGFHVHDQAGPFVWVTVGQPLEPGQWYHVAATYDGSAVTSYLNGVEAESTPLSGLFVSSAPLLIGDDGWGNHFAGEIDEIRIQKRALSVDEIAASYQADGRTFTRRFSNLIQGTHVYQAFAVATNGQRAETEVRTLSVSGGQLCRDVDCSGHGSCAEELGEARCHCEDGYHPEGLSCVENGEPFSVITAHSKTIREDWQWKDGTSTLILAACRGQIISGVVKVVPSVDVEGLLVETSNLVSGQDVIAASAVDVRVVKRWYRHYHGDRRLQPDLLLKDDALVRVDQAAEHNYVRSTDDGVDTYLLASRDLADGEIDRSLDNLHPYDATSLQPVDRGIGETIEYWVNFEIPDDAPSGTYQGELYITANGAVQVLPVSLRVYPFNLEPSPLLYSLADVSRICDPGARVNGAPYGYCRTEEQYRAQLVDMKKHGVEYPTCYETRSHATHLQTLLQIRQDVGLPTDKFFVMGLPDWVGDETSESALNAIRANVTAWKDILDDYGYQDVYFYGMDEWRMPRFGTEMPAWEAVHDAGGKMFVAVRAESQYVEAAGSLLDIPVLAGTLQPEIAAQWHAVGSKVYSYANPQVGAIIAPLVYRNNFGLALWKAGYDGAEDWAYQYQHGTMWNDFDGTMQDEVFAFVTMTGVVDTIAFEGYREAIYDVRYVATLEQAIAQAPAGKEQIAQQAQAYLDGLEIPDKRWDFQVDLDEVRAQIASWILQLQP